MLAELRTCWCCRAGSRRRAGGVVPKGGCRRRISGAAGVSVQQGAPASAGARHRWPHAHHRPVRMLEVVLQVDHGFSDVTCSEQGFLLLLSCMVCTSVQGDQAFAGKESVVIALERPGQANTLRGGVRRQQHPQQGEIAAALRWSQQGGRPNADLQITGVRADAIGINRSFSMLIAASRRVVDVICQSSPCET